MTSLFEEGSPTTYSCCKHVEENGEGLQHHRYTFLWVWLAMHTDACLGEAFGHKPVTIQAKWNYEIWIIPLTCNVVFFDQKLMRFEPIERDWGEAFQVRLRAQAAN